jgi:hypothetical protein
MFLTSETDMSLQKGRIKLFGTVTVRAILRHIFSTSIEPMINLSSGRCEARTPQPHAYSRM